MILCVPTTDEAGADARVSGHFGRAPYFTFVDMDSGEIRSLENPGHDAGHPPDFVLEQGVDALAVRGLGRGAYMRFTRAGVQLLKTEEPTVAATIEAIREDRLSPLPEAELHQGGHHHGGGGHEGVH